MNAQLVHDILGDLILRPSLLEDTDLTANDFPQGRERETFCAISSLWEAGRPSEIPLALLAEQISGDSPATFVAGLINGNLPKTPAAFALLVDACRKRRIMQRILSMSQDEVRRSLKTGEVDPAKLDEIVGMYSELKGLDGRGFNPAKALVTGSDLQALDITLDWTVERLLPSRSLTLLHSRGGLGKTWISLALAKAVNSGAPFLGLETKKRPVYYVDLENPLPLLVERVRLLDIRDVQFWHLSATPRPPKLDGDDWHFYKTVPELGSLVIIDTLRAAHDGDENSSQDAAIVMNRLKEIREAGHDVLCLHHTGKADARVYKGSTAWSDLSDHVIDFHRVRQGSLEEIDDDDQEPDALYSLGTGEKTRFAPFRVYLTFDRASGTFNPTQGPKAALLDQLAEFIRGEGCGHNQSQIMAWAKDNLGLKKRDNILALLRSGEGVRWHSRIGFRGARHYEPL